LATGRVNSHHSEFDKLNYADSLDIIRNIDYTSHGLILNRSLHWT